MLVRVAPEPTKRRRLWFAAVAVCGSVLVAFAAALMIDLYLHAKYERTASVNRWGYRGPVIPRKESNERRVAVLGGSAAFGYGPDWDGSFPYFLERKLNEVGSAGRRFSVVNLAYNNEGAYSFRYTLEDYAYLGSDIVILYEGYNDLGDRPNERVARRASAVFRATGYFPIFPVVFREKAAALVSGSAGSAYRGQTTFRAGLVDRATASALQAAAATAESLERQLGRLTTDGRSEDPALPSSGCDNRWQHYCRAVYDAVHWARERNAGVLVGTQPFISDNHVDQQNAMIGMLRERFGRDPGVVHVHVGRAIDLRDSPLSYDGMHLTAEGNALVAQAFVEPVLRIAAMLDRP
jgi:hypothetical protein